jgi:hypothetical protein
MREMTSVETQAPGEPQAPPRETRPEPARRESGGVRSAWDRAWAYSRANPALVWTIVVGLIARVTFWAVTNRRLDDALITIKFDKNLADGVGFVHNLGDGHVQGFTSALSVLVPLPGELIYGGGGIQLIRLVSLGAFVLAAIYAYLIAREFKLGTWPTVFALAYLALDQNQVFFGMSGMETQIAVAVLLGGIYYVLVEDFPKAGVALGLALLARPDFVLWFVPAYVFLFIRDWRGALRAFAISAAILAPWVLFTTIYFGSPVPHTIAAKSLSFAPTLPGLTHPVAWIHFLGDQLSASSHSWTIFAPFYEAIFITHSPLSYGVAKAIAFVVAGLAIVGGLSTIRRASWLPAIACLILLLAYKVIFLAVGYFEWYGAPTTALLVLMAAIGLDRISIWLAAASRNRFRPAEVALVPAVLLALVYAMVLPYRTVVEARVQHDIEDKVRQPLGEYLGQVVKPGESITSESSGYVGWETNGTLYDYPGLESTSVVDAIRKAEAAHAQGFPDSLAGIAHLLRPDWLVLRPWEAKAFPVWYPGIMRNYTEVRRFSVPGGREPISFEGFSILNIDRTFIVLRRKD